eukprot:TRINITY_DN6944_c0_g4_i1.p1 TRINITY_DN6944_c0_g4~~TRINITY_DN6944_c0_g4_i1.p1  ORF type:complete len:211 (+),score=30.43 TRINITY_DN6944_c0_g4_i1:62-634(+)
MARSVVLSEDYFVRKLEEAAKNLNTFSHNNTSRKKTQLKCEVEVQKFQQGEEDQNFKNQIQANLATKLVEEGCYGWQKQINDEDDVSVKSKMLDLLKLIPPPPPPPPMPPFLDECYNTVNQQQSSQYGDSISLKQDQFEQVGNCEESIYQEAKSFSEAMNQPELVDILMKYYYSGYSDGVKSKQIQSILK